MDQISLIHQKIQQERTQNLITRRNLYQKIQEETKLPIVSLFTSFTHPVIIEDHDADMLEDLLRNIDLSNGFYFLLSSPGGDGLAAERIIKICRSYSKTSNFKVIVPGKAKSAATMICLGSEEIVMSETSELGPIDPQILIPNEEKRFSAFNIVKSYQKIFDNAQSASGNLEPYLQALSVYDPRIVEDCLSYIDLSKDIAIKALKTGMLSNDGDEEISKKISILTIPRETKVHGRAIYYDDLIKIGLNVNTALAKTDIWSSVYELYVRLYELVNSNNAAKCIETMDASLIGSVKRG